MSHPIPAIAARQTLEANAGVIETFVMQYLFDNGIGVQLIEAVARDLFGQQVVVNGTVPEGVASSPRELLADAIKDVVNVFTGEYNLERVIASAASLEFLVRYARKVNPAVFPPEAIPTDEVVAAALELFNAPKLAQLSSNSPALSPTN